MNYYNEFDKFAAQWLNELIKAGHIADGVVDDRSIKDVMPSDLEGFTQCHFFAGIGGWPLALRTAGWADNRPVFTGSCPCQPFSSAGKGKGVKDDRHLWPEFYRLIKECRPTTVFGEQVAQKAGAAWFDIVQADMEAQDYACGMVVFPACSVGAPHQRQRLYWVADTGGARPQRGERSGAAGKKGLSGRHSSECRTTDSMADTQLYGHTTAKDRRRIGTEQGEGRLFKSSGACATGDMANATGDDQRRAWQSQSCGTGTGGGCGATGSMADADSERQKREWPDDNTEGRERQDFRQAGLCDRAGATDTAYPTNGYWRNTDWLGCRDGKFRAIKPGTFPLVDELSTGVVLGSDIGVSDVESTKEARVMRLRGYGNAIVISQAAAFIESYVESR